MKYLREFLAKQDLESIRPVPGMMSLPLLFIVILWMTPFKTRFETESLIFGLLLFGWTTSYLLHFILTKNQREDLRRREVGSIFIVGNGAIWGSFVAFVVSAVELGWTSFFTLLLTGTLCAGMASALAGRLLLAVAFLTSVITPAFTSALIHTSGTHMKALVFYFAWIFGLFIAHAILTRAEPKS